MKDTTCTFDEWYMENRVKYMHLPIEDMQKLHEKETVLPGYNSITLEELEHIMAITVFEEERKKKGWRILTNKKGALQYLTEVYKDPLFADKAKELLKEAEETFTEGPYVITDVGISPYGFRL